MSDTRKETAVQTGLNKQPIMLLRPAASYFPVIYSLARWFLSSVHVLHPQTKFREATFQEALQSSQGPLISLASANGWSLNDFSKAGITVSSDSGYGRLKDGSYSKGNQIRPEVRPDVIRVNHFIARQISRGLPIFSMVQDVDTFINVLKEFGITSNVDSGEQIKGTIGLPQSVYDKLKFKDFIPTLEQLHM